MREFGAHKPCLAVTVQCTVKCAHVGLIKIISDIEDSGKTLREKIFRKEISNFLSETIGK